MGIAKKTPKYKGKGIRFTPLLARTVDMPTPDHTIKFAKYSDRLMANVNPHHYTYMTSKSPLATKGSKLRGTIAENVAKKHFRLDGYTISEPETSIRVDGRATSRGQETYEFGIEKDGVEMRKQEIKLVRLSFNSFMRRWEAHFENVKFNLHDDTILVLEGLTSMCLFKWGGKNAQGNGKKEKAQGKKIVIS